MVNSVDVRLEKAFKFRTSTAALDLDVFNVGNSGTVLGRTYDMRLTGATGFNQTLEIMNPRILRLGARASRSSCQSSCQLPVLLAAGHWRLPTRLHWTPGRLSRFGVFSFRACQRLTYGGNVLCPVSTPSRSRSVCPCFLPRAAAAEAAAAAEPGPVAARPRRPRPPPIPARRRSWPTPPSRPSVIWRQSGRRSTRNRSSTATRAAGGSRRRR